MIYYAKAASLHVCVPLFVFQNKSDGATEKFQEIHGAYKYLTEGEAHIFHL